MRYSEIAEKNLYHGTSAAAADYIMANGFGTGQRFGGMASDDQTMRGFTFLTPSKDTATWYAANNLRHNDGAVMRVKFEAHAWKVPGQVNVYQAFAAAGDALGVGRDENGHLKIAEIASELLAHTFNAISFKDRDSNGRATVVVLDPRQAHAVSSASLKESEMSDSVSRKMALRAHRQIAYWLDQNSERLEQRLIAIPEGPLKGGYMLRAPTCDLDDLYDLAVVFVPKGYEDPNAPGNTLGGGFFKKQGISVIVVACMIAPFDTKNLATRFSVGAKRDFIHEFQHYLLSHKTKKKKGSTGHVAAGDLAAYFNDPDETNAYYQEAAHEFQTLIRTVLANAPGHIGRWKNKSDPELVNDCMRYLSKDFVHYMNSDTRRAIQKRFARFVRETIRPMMERTDALP